MENVNLVVASNSISGFGRFFQAMWRLLLLRLRQRPDVYMLGFRSYEIFWIVRLITIGKPLVYDEFINPYLWFVEEHCKFKPKNLPAKLLRRYTGWMLDSADKVLSDTKLHAEYSARAFDVPLSKFVPVYVGTDEEKFRPIKNITSGRQDVFKIFFYGNFLPLHGVNVILDVAKILNNPNMEFTIVGGAKRPGDKKQFLDKVEKYGLSNIRHESWVDFDKLPGMIAGADLCLGGPFGGTPQAQKVITGKTYQFLAMEKPTVIGKIREEVGFSDKKNCLLVEQDNPRALSEAISWAHNHREQLKAIGLSGRALYDERFSRKAQQPVIERTLKELAAHKQG